MDLYLTTYRKDYLWPYLLKAPGTELLPELQHDCLAEIPEFSGEEMAFYQACVQHSRPPYCPQYCPQYSGDVMPQLPPGKRGWSRSEIMGPLLDPKLYPVCVAAAPETQRYEQPNTFLDKLQSKYPNSYDILQSDASPESKRRFDRDRNKTTYYVDYCERGPVVKFDYLRRAADEIGSGPLVQPMRLSGDPCHVAPKAHMTTSRIIPKQFASSPDLRVKCETSLVQPLGYTEYQDKVSKLGGIIMRDNLHRK